MSDGAAGKNTSVHGETCRRIHDEIVAAIGRQPALVAEFNGLSEVDQAWFMYGRALDRLARGECAGLVRRPPARVVALRAEKLQGSQL